MNLRTSLAVLSLCSLGAGLIAQRPTPTFEHMKRAATLEFGAVPLGKHSLEELQVGQTWRLGNNEASVIRLDLPLIAGDSIVAPGAYRVQLQRSAQEACALLVNGSNLALGPTGDGRVEGKLGKAGKPTKKLDIQWRKNGGAAGGNQPAQIVVQYGTDEWVGDVVLAGHQPAAVAGFKIAVFQIPAARLESGAATPVATFQKGDDRWNLVVEKDSVKLVPWMAAPTEQFGFGEVRGPAAERIVAGRVGKLEMKVDAAMETLQHLSTRKDGNEIHVAVGYARERVEWIVPEPKNKPGK